MTRRRWIADEVSGDRAALTGQHAYHLCRVLRARVGQEFDVATGDSVRRGRVSSVEENRIEIELLEEVASAEPAPIILLLSVFKFDRMEWAIEKCTELGVARIIPVIAQRTERHLAQAAAKRVDRWRRISQQAAEQARRAAVPEVAAPIALKDAVQSAAGTRVVLDETDQRTPVKDLLRDLTGELSLATGPEGGWTSSELDDFHAAGWLSASLGSTILRVETAAIAAVAVAVHELG